jgi:hypothetical protein
MKETYPGGWDIPFLDTCKNWNETSIFLCQKGGEGDKERQTLPALPYFLFIIP